MHQCYYCEQLFDSKEALFEHVEIHSDMEINKEIIILHPNLINSNFNCIFFQLFFEPNFCFLFLTYYPLPVYYSLLTTLPFFLLPATCQYKYSISYIKLLYVILLFPLLYSYIPICTFLGLLAFLFLLLKTPSHTSFLLYFSFIFSLKFLSSLQLQTSCNSPSLYTFIYSLYILPYLYLHVSISYICFIKLTYMFSIRESTYYFTSMSISYNCVMHSVVRFCPLLLVTLLFLIFSLVFRSFLHLPYLSSLQLLT